MFLRTTLPTLALLAGTALVAPQTGAAAAPETAPPDRTAFDLQAHRGGLGLTVESTIPAFAKALELGVSTLELDVQITQDGEAVVTHDRQVSGSKCLDTAPATPGDPEYPYVGKYVHTLTLAQVKTLDCGTLTQPQHPDQQAVPGERMPLLSDVFALVRAYDAQGVMLNVETKVEAGAPSETAPREQFVQVVSQEIRQARIAKQITIQSFDWGALMRMHEVAPRLPLVALTNRDFLQVGQPGASPWLGGIDIDDFDGSLIRAVASFDASAVSPVHGFPQDGTVDDPDYEPYVTRAMVRDAHRHDLAVIPWTVDDKPTMRALMDVGVDGLITDYPDRLREVMAERGLALPPSYDPPAEGVEPLQQAHAHNDYEHQRPLFDALGHGFTSVEADVWLVDGELLVAHDRADVVPGRTLESLYLDPLKRRVARNDGDVYAGWDGYFQLLIDAKSAAGPTYAALDDTLRDYPRIMTRFVNGRTLDSAVTAVISGNRDRETMEEQRVRFAGYDGRMPDLESGVSASFMPLLSDNWTNHFAWQGQGEMPQAQRDRLHEIVDTAHASGYRVRFWATPDQPGPAREAVWDELVAAGVDQINTDDLAGLEEYLRAVGT